MTGIPSIASPVPSSIQVRKDEHFVRSVVAVCETCGLTITENTERWIHFVSGIPDCKDPNDLTNRTTNKTTAPAASATTRAAPAV